MDEVSDVDKESLPGSQEGGREEFRQRNGHVTINVEPETPVSSVKKGILKTLNLETSSGKAELRKAEVKMTEAFVTFHHKLRLLKSYRYMITYTAMPD